MDSVPFVSIVMPVRNESAFIERTLGAVLAQNYPSERMEILVADGMSDDGMRDIVQRLIANNPHQSIRIVDNPRGIVPTGLNVAIQEARGDVIARVDGHTIIAPDYLSEGVAMLTRSGADNVGGLMVPIGHKWIGKTIALAHNLRFGLGGGLFHLATKETEADTVYMGIFRRDVFDRVGFFDEDLVRNQDIELNGRIRRTGGRIVLSPRIRSTYFCRSSLRDLWKQNYTNGVWLLQTVVKTAEAFSWRHYVPLAFVSAVLISTVVSVVLTGGWIILATVVGSYLLSSLVASLVAAARHGWCFAVSLPFVFAILHFSYGIGSLVGLCVMIARSLKRRLHKVLNSKLNQSIP